MVQRGIHLYGNNTALIPGQVGYSDQQLQEVDSAVILAQQEGYRLLNKKKITGEGA